MKEKEDESPAKDNEKSSVKVTMETAVAETEPTPLPQSKAAETDD